MTYEEAKKIINYLQDYDGNPYCLGNRVRCWAELRNHFEKYKWHDLRKNPEDLPKSEEIVRIACERYDKKGYFTLDAFYEDGSVHSEESDFCFTELDEWAEYCEETDDYIIPEGWLEYAMFAECFGAVDYEVIAWREIEPFEGVK